MKQMNPQQYPPGQPQQQPQPQWPPQTPQPVQPGHDPYGFILNPEQPKKHTNLGGPMRWLVILGGAAGIIILLVIILAIMRGGGSDTTAYVKLVQQQQEIVRVAGLQDTEVRQPSVMSFVTNTELSVASDQSKLEAYLNKGGIKISTKEIAAGANVDTDAQLETAVSSNTVDTVMVGVLQKELTDYQATLSLAYKSSTNKTTKALLVDLNNNAKLLLEQSKQ